MQFIKTNLYFVASTLWQKICDSPCIWCWQVWWIFIY